MPNSLGCGSQTPLVDRASVSAPYEQQARTTKQQARTHQGKDRPRPGLGALVRWRVACAGETDGSARSRSGATVGIGPRHSLGNRRGNGRRCRCRRGCCCGGGCRGRRRSNRGCRCRRWRRSSRGRGRGRRCRCRCGRWRRRGRRYGCRCRRRSGRRSGRRRGRGRRRGCRSRRGCRDDLLVDERAGHMFTRREVNKGCAACQIHWRPVIALNGSERPGSGRRTLDDLPHAGPQRLDEQ